MSQCQINDFAEQLSKLYDRVKPHVALDSRWVQLLCDKLVMLFISWSLDVKSTHFLHKTLSFFEKHMNSYCFTWWFHNEINKTCNRKKKSRTRRWLSAISAVQGSVLVSFPSVVLSLVTFWFYSCLHQASCFSLVLDAFNKLIFRRKKKRLWETVQLPSTKRRTWAWT